jgi:hypothetical protein
MAAKFCEELKDPKKCVSNITKEDLYDSYKYTLASQDDTDLFIEIDHDESRCNHVFRGECYYTIVIMGTESPGNFAKF